MKFTLILNKTDVQKTYQQIVDTSIKQVTVKGFRKGKAPKNVAEPLLDKNKVYESVFNQLLPPLYSQHLKKHDLHPITKPKINVKSMALDQDWEVEIEIAQKPKVTLNHFEAEVKKVNQQYAKLKDKKHDESHQVNAIHETLLKTCQLKVPQLLIDEAVQFSLSKLADQVTKLGLSLDQYLESMKKTYPDLRQEYALQAENDLKIEFILESIAQNKKLVPKAADLKQVIASIKDPKTKEFVQNDPETQFSIHTSLMRTNVINHLKSL